MRKLIFLLIVVSLSLVFTTFKLSKSSATPVNSAHTTVMPEPATLKDDVEVINGEITPEKIPEHEAYIILFRFIARRETEEEKNRIKSYLAQALGCNKCEGPNPSEQADIDTLIAAAAEFDQQVSVLDMQAGIVLEKYHPDHLPLTPVDKEFLGRLQRQKEDIADKVADSLKTRLSSEGLKNLRNHIKERMKRKMKIFRKKSTQTL